MEKINSAQGYQVFRSEKMNGRYKRIKVISGNSTFSYLDTEAVCGKTYYYKIRAYVKNQGNVVCSESK